MYHSSGFREKAARAYFMCKNMGLHDRYMFVRYSGIIDDCDIYLYVNGMIETRATNHCQTADIIVVACPLASYGQYT